jgi:hypothetical protein
VQEQEVLMSSAVVLGVGLDSTMLAAQSSIWRSAGFIVTPVFSIREAIEHFEYGDFDLVLLGHSLGKEGKERLTHLIKSWASRTPVVSISNAPIEREPFADATLRNDPGEVLSKMDELIAEKPVGWRDTHREIVRIAPRSRSSGRMASTPPG